MKHVPVSQVLFCVFLLFIGCNPPEPDNRAVDEAALRETDISWSASIEAGDLDAHNSFFLEDAVVLAPNEPMISGRSAIREAVAGYLAIPGFSVKWSPEKVEVARSGELGYTRGSVVITMTGPDGLPMVDRGKYTTIWKKQADGTWKVAVDIFNSDTPVAQ